MAEGIAADFQDALEDLRSSDEYAIANLVVIARENIQFAESISRVVVNHITKTRPDWKLPAMYVLDAISKRVGSPYTIYFQRNLFKTFMNAYSAMDPANRRAMDALLQTWKQPVPGSRDPTPVYPSHVTQEIERPLMQWRTAALQNQQPPRPSGPYVPQFAPGDPRAARFGRTPPPANAVLPPTADRASAPPQTYPNQNGQYNALPARGQPYTQTPPPSNSAQYQPSTPQYGQPQQHVPTPPSGMYQYNQPVAPQNNQPAYPPRPYSTPMAQPNTMTPQPVAQPPIPAPGAAPVPPPMDPEAAKRLLAQILGNMVTNPAAVSTPPPPAVQPVPSGLPPIYPPLTNLNLPFSTTAQQMPTIPAALARHSPAPPSSTFPDLRNPASLKVPHPELIRKLFQPDQCKTCGKRFAATLEGKKKKQQHMDWHYHNNTRLAEAQKAWKLTQRSWFVGEKEWISYREDPYGSSNDTESGPNAGKGGANGGKKEEERVVPVPIGADAGGSKCPVCQERFETRWDKERDLPVWRDAVEVRGMGVVHWSCWEEAYGKRARVGSARGTPEGSVLGKRKARE